MDDLSAWIALGQTLGLTAQAVSEYSMLGWSFAAFRREIAEPATSDRKTTPWLHGMWKGVATIVRPVTKVSPPPHKSLFSLEWHSPLDLLAQPSIHQYTMALAEISPQLLAGVRMASASTGTLRFGPAVTPPVPLGATLDRAFSTYAGNPQRLQALFERRGPADEFPERSRRRPSVRESRSRTVWSRCFSAGQCSIRPSWAASSTWPSRSRRSSRGEHPSCRRTRRSRR